MLNKIPGLISLFLLIIPSFSCGNQAENYAGESQLPGMPLKKSAGSEQNHLPDNNIPEIERKVIREGEIGFETSSVAKTKENIITQDVTEEFIDIETRVGTKKELEKRYKELLTKANTVNEILALVSGGVNELMAFCLDYIWNCSISQKKKKIPENQEISPRWTRFARSLTSLSGLPSSFF